ncbi:SusD/RagB family nutrient-binding outer membrane lipoprotein [Plebeiibacterium marinum]|uniref:SusD/RagB family nutrient-binding outer membrane lipoprotein n=1 Tax=Plebeiibacterium marinum TaxID=2992111 RepID=A0AAE3SJ50_9BACT|nr:SusD/RagB family nutrient-binding outer membrane lipoprotein [Plebeiobacterium marinum]MCW3805400.1 SusD/RagB family nutrient-binding outer membrane lipoprotein [Plebeiobacterium marinum]
MKKLLIIFFVSVLFASCDDFLDVNEDPNNPTVVTPELVLPVAQVYTGEYVLDYDMANHLGNMLMYNWSETYGFSWYQEEFDYLVSTTFHDDLFDDAYLYCLKHYKDLYDREEKYNNYRAISMIMMAYHFQMLVDFYGDVPYTEALARGGNPTPKYDQAEAVYDSIMIQLDDAIQLINSESTSEVAFESVVNDVIFDGDMKKWKQFANTIKLRILVREANVKGDTYVTAEIAKITAEGSGYITSDVLVNPGYLKETNKQNPFWDSFGEDSSGNTTMNHNATCATQFIIDYLVSTGDPRIDTLFQKGPDSETHLGVEQGVVNLTSDYDQTHVSLIGAGLLKGYDAGAPIFTLAESYFNQAEAALNGFGGNAKDLYENGVKASFSYLGTEGVEDYLSQNIANVSWDYSNNKLEAIITQKWLGLMGVNAEQSWFDYTRTGFPSNLPISLQADTEDRPVRLFYPNSEITGNTKNVPSQKDAFTDKIFWAE